jgi:WD40 repeat protein
MLGKSGPSNYFDTRTIVSNYELKKEIKCLALHPNQSLVACGCSSDFKLVKIDPNNSALTEIHPSLLQAAQSPTPITDLTWNPIDQTRLAVCYTNGDLKCFNLNTGSQQKALTVDWIGERSTQTIHRISWSRHEAHLLASGNSEGSIKLYDIRAGKTFIQCFKLKGAISSPCRDFKFNSIDGNMIASASDNGRLMIWDRRTVAKPLMNTEAHKNKVLTIAWNPFSEWIIASGSADKTVKIWDTSRCNISETTMTKTTDHSEGMIDPMLMQTLHTSAEVNRVSWNPARNLTGGGGPARHLMTVSLPASSVENTGYISIWDTASAASRCNNIPICVLKGHSNENLCSVAEWLDCPKRPSDLFEYPLNISSSSAISNSNNNINNNNNNSNNPTAVSQEKNRFGGSGGPGKSNKGSKQQNKSNNVISTTASSSGNNTPSGRRDYLTRIAMFCVISGSAGKDGTLLIQNPKFGYFPYNHISPVVARISSQGGLAFQRGDFKKVRKNTPLFFYFNCFFLLIDGRTEVTDSQ